MKLNVRAGRPAFTLIELLAVITIIIILASLVVSGMAYVQQRQSRERARVQIERLSTALEAYKAEMGLYPLTTNSADGLGNSANSLYIPLFYEGFDYKRQASPPAVWEKPSGTGTIAKSTSIYLADLDPTTTKQGWVDVVATIPASTKVNDPWGNEYRYRSGQDSSGTVNPSTQNPDFDLWSVGKDGLTNTAAPLDVSNRDDIKNF